MLNAGVHEHANRVIATVRRHASGETCSNLILRSWQRCVNDYALNPGGAHEGCETTRAELEQRLERNDLLLTNAKAEMSSLVQQFVNLDTVVVIADSAGIVLHAMGDGDFARQAARVGMRPGGDWSERANGTNGIGTCLAEGKLVNVDRSEHFFPNLTRLSCTGAPIFDDAGDLAGVLDVSSEPDLSQQHFRTLIGMSAQTIGNRLLEAKCHKLCIVRMHSRRELVHTFLEGLVAVDEDGIIRAVNQSALFQLGIPERSKLVGRNLSEIFQVTIGELISRSRIHAGQGVPVQGVGGRFFFLLAGEPGGASASSPVINGARLRAAAETAAVAPWLPGASGSRASEFGDDGMERDFARALRVYDRGVYVLLEGETGSGKERFSRALHEAGSRSRGPFVAVNCAAVPENLIESELFGYRGGAFTGASREGRRGRILAADKGTLLLDEIGDMPLALQARLLRVLEEREVTPLGGDSSVKVDVRLICATHRNLREMVAAGQFRSDLYFRLACFTVSLPPLRLRAGRRRLIRAMLAEIAPNLQIDDAAVSKLEHFPWPGNLRQLRNVLQTASALCDSNLIRLGDLPADIRDHLPAVTPAAAVPASLSEAIAVGDVGSAVANARDLAPGSDGAGWSFLDRAEREALLDLLRRHRWNVTNVAAELGVSRNTVYRKTNRFGLARE